MSLHYVSIIHVVAPVSQVGMGTENDQLDVAQALWRALQQGRDLEIDAAVVKGETPHGKSLCVAKVND